MFARKWADYEDDEALPPIPWLVKAEPVPENKPLNNKFWLLDLEEEDDTDEEFDEDFCIGCESGTDCASSHTCCNCN